MREIPMPSITVDEVLIAAKKLIEDPKRFDPKLLAADKNGIPVNPSSPEAVKWCVVGAISNIINDHTRKINDQIRNQVIDAVNQAMGSIGPYVLSHSHDEVIARLNEAITNQETTDA